MSIEVNYKLITEVPTQFHCTLRVEMASSHTRMEEIIPQNHVLESHYLAIKAKSTSAAASV